MESTAKIKLLKILGTIAFAIFVLTQTSIGFAQDETATAKQPPGENQAGASEEVAAAKDMIVPSDVENVKVEPGDSEVSLSWDVATDDVAVVGYRVYYGTQSVGEESQAYEFLPLSVEDVVTATVTNLENEKTHYFAVTAIDAVGNESSSYSSEVSATPQAGLRQSSIEDDGKNPEVKEIEVKAADELKVVFSESVVLPIENPEKAFVIKSKKDEKVTLAVKRAELDPEDEIGAAVILLTDNQTSEEEYELTVAVEIEDHFGNTVVKDQGDKIMFKGFAIKKEKKSSDSTPPDVAKAEVEESNQVTVTFTEAVVLSDDPKSHFTIMNKENNKSLKVVNVSLDKEGKVAYVRTDPHENVEYEIKIAGVEDAAGNELKESSRKFRGKPSSLRDLIPPEDITQLVAKISEIQKNVVEMSWKKSKNTAGDLADQMLYQSLDRGKHYDKGTSLGPDAEQAEVKNLKPGRLYTFKITSKDTSGNESKGTIVSIRLPETGPALPLALGVSLLVGVLARKKKA